MTDFPELQHALVDAARRRYAPRRRAWQVVRVAAPVAAAAAVVLAVIGVLGGEPASDERPASPSPTPVATLAPTDALSRMYEVFRRPATGADELPALDSSAPLDEFGTTIDPDRARLLVERGDTRVYAVAASRRDRPSVCVLEVVGEAQARSTCRLIEENPGLGGTVTYLPVLVDGRAAIAALGADDVHELEIEFPGGEVARHEFKNSTVLAPADPWPSGLHYVNDAGGSVFMDVLPEDNPAG